MRISKKEKKAEPVTSAKKNALCRQKRKFEKQIETLQEEVNELQRKANKTTLKRLKEETNLVSRTLLSLLSPSTKWKTKKKFVESSPKGICHMLCSVLGVNIHQSSSIGTEMLQQKPIKAFMERNDVSKVCPCMKTVTLGKCANQVQNVAWRLHTSSFVKKIEVLAVFLHLQKIYHQISSDQTQRHGIPVSVGLVLIQKSNRRSCQRQRKTHLLLWPRIALMKMSEKR